MLKIFKQGLKW